MRRPIKFPGRFTLAAAALLVSGCIAPRALRTGQTALVQEQLARDIATLASDAFEGRLPGTPAGAMTVEYIEERFRQLGLEPGNDGSYRQETPLISVVPDTQSHLVVQGGGEPLRLRFGPDFVARSGGYEEDISFENTELVFVGYGAVAPEWDWNDYAGVDVEGNLVIILRGDPGFVRDDTLHFTGRKATSHALFGAKYRCAGERGAAGALVIVDPALSNSRATWLGFKRRATRPHTVLAPNGDATPRPGVDGYLHLSAGRQILALAGLDYDSLVVAAAKPGFKPFALHLRATGVVQSTIRRFSSPNVLACLPGAQRPDEFIIYTAHWDHLGKDTTLTGDQIFNGAADNATGTASILNLAEAFSRLDRRPDRSVMFMGFTAEESGLHGSRFYVENPAVPLTQTVAVINIDMLVSYGRSRDIIIIGNGRSELDEYVQRAAKRLDMTVSPDRQPEEGFYLRSDHINFARKGVPALSLDPGMDHVEHGPAWGLEQNRRFMRESYHQVSDEFDESWDLAGIMDYLRILFDIGYTLSNEEKFPNWHRDEEFRAIRDGMMQGE